jgi:hypothetical protein
MHAFTKAISRLKSELRDAEAMRLRQTNTVKRAECRGKETGLRRAIALLESHRDGNLDDLVELVRSEVDPAAKAEGRA